MILTIHTETTIDSCHQLIGHKGKCKYLHGHTWKIRLFFRGSSSTLDKVGILVDFGIVKELKELLDHKNLNDILESNNPTAENLTLFIYEWLSNKIEAVDIKVRVYETAVDKKTYCEGGDF